MVRNGVVAYISNAVASTLAIFVLAGYLDEKLAAAVVVAVSAWAAVAVAVNDMRKNRPTT